MAYFEDLSPNWQPVELIRSMVMLCGVTTVLEPVHVGWLAPLHPYPKGRTPEDFREKLRVVCTSLYLPHRGFFSCKMGICKILPGWPRGVGEIFVPGRLRTYIAPTLVYHYVAWHRYQPPQEFVDAVVELQNHSAWPPKAGGLVQFMAEQLTRPLNRSHHRDAALLNRHRRLRLTGHTEWGFDTAS